MQLTELLAGVRVLRRLGQDVAVTGVEYDSRRVRPGSLFVAMRGETTNGNQYTEQAAANGASAVVTDSAAAFDAAAAGPFEVALVEVPNGRRALAEVSAQFFGHPERALAVSGVTGTNGKTTTAFLLEQMLEQAGRETVLVGTIEYRIGGEARPAPHTTPESRDLLALFAEGVAAGASEAVMEVSSHALVQGRVWGVPFDTAIFTNLTRDHLDYHGTMEEYFEAKALLFAPRQESGVAAPRAAILNADDAAGVRLIEIARAAGSSVVTYGIERGEFRAREIEMRLDGMGFRVETAEGSVADVQTRLTGRVNVYNLLAAAAAAVTRGIPLDAIAAAAPSLKPVPGRFELVSEGQEFAVAVDYAHTDDALRNVIALARELVKPHAGRVITLFGCGGDRDRSKRPLMGRAAAEGSEVVVLTSDNPRSEDPRAIIRDVLPGLAGSAAAYHVEPDRRRAIGLAISMARPGDLVLLAGKGHEKTQTIGATVLPFDDVVEARQALRAMGGGAKG
jgi:UDP-N-acetylmuramoyl-L-alanyl-D-glutamate--2,6-diaminopimelate ligase